MRVFHVCDEDAINVTELPSDVAQLLLQKGPTFLNVDLLTNEQVIKYIQTSFGQFGHDIELLLEVTVPDTVIDWLVLFWEWFGGWSSRSELFQSISTLFLVPTSRNTLVPSAHGIFDCAWELNMTVWEALETIGISFLHPKVTFTARLALVEQGVVKSAMNGHHILDHISEDRASSIKSSAASAFRHHILSSLANLPRLRQQQQARLRCLPIYPILTPSLSETSGSCATRETKAIADGQTIKCVVGTILIPVIPDTTFLEDSVMLLNYLHGELLNANGVLSLAVDHIAQQPKHLQRAFVEHLVKVRDGVTPALLRKLSRAPFVNVCGGSVRAPQDLFDPECPVAALLPNDSRCPCLSSVDDEAIVAGLRSLHLLQTMLTNEFIEERIAYFSRCRSAQNTDLAKRLIQLIVDLSYDCSRLDIHPDRKWLPTKEGLLGSRECHHPDAHSSDLFDEVLPVVAVDRISMSLVQALAWGASIPLTVVKDQLQKVLQFKRFEKLLCIISELGKRAADLAAQDVNGLRLLTSDHPWIPISHSHVAFTSHALLSSQFDVPPGFYVIPFHWADNSDVRRFLKLMGCNER